MKRFRFTLQPVALLRAQREARAREALTAALRTASAAEQQLATLQRRLAGLAAALLAGRVGCFHAAAEANCLHGYQREATAERAAEQALAAARLAVSRRRVEYREARRECEVVRRLESKARQAHRAAAQRAEQAEYDEFATRAAAVGRQPSFSP